MSTEYKSQFLASWHIKGRIDNFLAWRCSKEFVTEYLAQHPKTLERVSEPGLYLSAVSEVNLAIRLHELALLPETNRQEFVRTVTDYAIKGEDFYALESERIRQLFTAEEVAAFHERVRDELLPNLADIRRNWEIEARSDQSPDEYMEPLLESMSSLQEDFSGEPAVVEAIEHEISQARDWIAERMDENPKKERPARQFGDVDSPDQPVTSTRSIFDDIDE